MKPERLYVYWEQIRIIKNINPKRVLEAGIGNGFVMEFLKRTGISVVGMDIEVRNKPDVAGNLLCIPFKDNSFDAVSCYEVLEHLPFERIEDVIRELKRVTRKYIFISVPHHVKCFNSWLSLGRWLSLGFCITLPRIRRVENIPLSDHKWEIGRLSVKLKEFINCLRRADLKLVKHYTIPMWHYHRFFILEKKNG